MFQSTDAHFQRRSCVQKAVLTGFSIQGQLINVEGIVGEVEILAL